MGTQSQFVLAYDLGGTKINAGIVDDTGNVLKILRASTDLSLGKHGVIDALAALGQELLGEETCRKNVRIIGLASAGPLDPIAGTLLNPTNLKTHGQSWGVFPIRDLLAEKIGLPVVLDNDAAAAILAERWVGEARGYDNALTLTLGTGLGVGVICNGELVRAGRHLHPEGGLTIINFSETEALKADQNGGIAESYLSAPGLARLFERKRNQRQTPNATRTHPTPREITELARSGDPTALAAFIDYAEILAAVLHNFALLFAPEIVILGGSFAQSADVFLDRTRKRLEERLQPFRNGVDLLPKIAVSQLRNQAGVIGGAAIAFQKSVFHKRTSQGN